MKVEKFCVTICMILLSSIDYLFRDLVLHGQRRLASCGNAGMLTFSLLYPERRDHCIVQASDSQLFMKCFL